MKQLFVPYWHWEDWKNGMWRRSEFSIEQAIDFTGNHIVYGNAMKEVIELWPYTMINNLTSPSVNKRAFLGHCAASYKIGCPEYTTRLAWKELTDIQRELADEIAQQTINEWKKKYSYILTNGNLDVTQMIYQMKHPQR